MLSEKAVLQNQREETEQSFLRQLDRGIDDTEAGRELPIEEAFKLVN